MRSIHHAAGHGVLVTDFARATLTRCLLDANGTADHAGVAAVSGGDPTLTGCLVRGHGAFGVKIHSTAHGKGSAAPASNRFEGNGARAAAAAGFLGQHPADSLSNRAAEWGHGPIDCREMCYRYADGLPPAFA